MLGAIKVWSNHTDKVLAELCNMLVDRQLLKVEIQKEEFSEKQREKQYIIETNQTLRVSEKPHIFQMLYLLCTNE